MKDFTIINHRFSSTFYLLRTLKVLTLTEK